MYHSYRQRNDAQDEVLLLVTKELELKLLISFGVRTHMKLLATSDYPTE